MVMDQHFGMIDHEWNPSINTIVLSFRLLSTGILLYSKIIGIQNNDVCMVYIHTYEALRWILTNAVVV